MLPSVNGLISFSKKMVKDKNVSKIDEELSMLDPIFVTTPSVALEQCRKVMFNMAATVMESYKLASDCLFTFNPESCERVRENEDFLDKTEDVLGEYLIKITEQHLVGEDNRLAVSYTHLDVYKRQGRNLSAPHGKL